MEDKKKFVIEQLDEALEERQNPDRRKVDQGHPGEDRRKFDRRTEENSGEQAQQ